LWALAGAALIGVGVLATALVLPTPPASLESGTAPTTVPVTTSPFTDDRSVEATATFAPERTLRAPAAGRVTASACQIGTLVQSGGSMVSIDGSPVLNLATAVPLWRDIERDTEGVDVSALQTELQRLGYGVDADGLAGPATLSAVKALLASVGAPSDRPGLPLAAVLWLPAPSVIPSACDAVQGDQLAADDELARLPAGLASIAITTLPDELLPGDRRVTVAGLEIALDAEGKAALPAELQRTDVLAAVIQPETGATVTLQATLSLVNAVEVAVVPPGSVITDGDLNCILVGGRPVPVRIAGSQLGETFVLFDGDPPAEIDARPANGRGCR
jgi:peptidoglycan hydrolase-like protein with peptidoglycan-binding domain